MANEKLFRSSMGGYNKQDVEKYIESLDIQYTQDKAELEREIRSMKDELSALPLLLETKEKYTVLCDENKSLIKEKTDLSDAIAAQGERMAETEKELCEVKEQSEKDMEALISENSELKARCEKAAEEKAGYEAEKSALSHKNDELKSQLSELSKEFDKLKSQTEELEERIESGEVYSDDDALQVQSQVEEILSQARSEARSLILRAKETSEKLISEANEKAQNEAEKAKAQSSELVSENLKKVKYLYKRKDELAEIFKDHKSKVDSFFSSLSDSLKGEDK